MEEVTTSKGRALLVPFKVPAKNEISLTVDSPNRKILSPENPPAPHPYPLRQHSIPWCHRKINNQIPDATKKTPLPAAATVVAVTASRRGNLNKKVVEGEVVVVVVMIEVVVRMERIEKRDLMEVRRVEKRDLIKDRVEKVEGERRNKQPPLGTRAKET